MTDPAHTLDAQQDGVIDSAAGPVGHRLRRRREELGYDVRQIAVALRIRAPYLAAIEEGRYQDLPGQAYITGFLRTYADYVGLDSAAILAAFRTEISGVDQKAELYFPAPVNERRVPGGALLLIAVLAAVAVYGGWYVLSTSDRPPTDPVPALPERLSSSTATPTNQPQTDTLTAPAVQQLLGQAQPTAPEVGASAQPQAYDAASTSAATPDATVPPTDAASTAAPATTATANTVAAGDAATVETEAEDEGEVPQLPESVAVPAQSAATNPQSTTTQPNPVIAGDGSASGRIFGQTTGPARVVIRAVEDSWIEIRDAKGTLWASRILRPGDRFMAPQTDGIALVTGNAGGLVVSVDGNDLPPLGAKSQVMKDVSLDPAALLRRAGR